MGQVIDTTQKESNAIDNISVDSKVQVTKAIYDMCSVRFAGYYFHKFEDGKYFVKPSTTNSLKMLKQLIIVNQN